MLGRFDRTKVAQAMEKQRDVTVATHEGAPLYVFSPGAGGASALAFLDDQALVMGTRAAVGQTVTSFVQGRDGLRSNPDLLALVQAVRPGATFWMAGDQSLLAAMPQAVPGLGGGASLALPGLKSLVVTGDLDPSVSFEAVAQAADEAAARQLSSMVQGLIALRHPGGRPKARAATARLGAHRDQRRLARAPQRPRELRAAGRAAARAARRAGPLRAARDALTHAVPVCDDVSQA